MSEKYSELNDEAQNVTNSTDATIEDGKTAGLALGVQAILGTIWWTACLFVFIPNTYNLSYYGTDLDIPIAWFWYNLGNPTHGWTATYGWTAASYLSIFILYVVGRVVETMTFILYLYEDYVNDMAVWVTTGGYWISVIGYMVPLTFSIL